MLSRFHLIPERHGQTDGQTDRIAISISRVSVLTRDKNCMFCLYYFYCCFLFLFLFYFLHIFLFLVLCVFLYFIITAALCV